MDPLTVFAAGFEKKGIDKATAHNMREAQRMGARSQSVPSKPKIRGLKPKAQPKPFGVPKPLPKPFNVPKPKPKPFDPGLRPRRDPAFDQFIKGRKKRGPSTARKAGRVIGKGMKGIGKVVKPAVRRIGKVVKDLGRGVKEAEVFYAAFFDELEKGGIEGVGKIQKQGAEDVFFAGFDENMGK